MQKKFKVFIDGREGTTGLQIESRISQRPDIELLIADPALRKDPEHRKKLLNEADAAFLCLPDAAAKESAALVENPHTVVIDTSTAHRTAPGWAYGFPELGAGFRDQIRQSKRIANPGCHATGFIALVYPLVKLGLLDPGAQLVCHSLTGYSGGGKKMIAAYEAPERPASYDSPRIYALGQTHKHLPEMAAITGIAHAPVFCPIVADYYSGMAVTVGLTAEELTCAATPATVAEALSDFYKGERLISVSADPGDGFLAGNDMAGRAELLIRVNGNAERITLTSVFDNLYKGASGAAVQNMNLALGADEYEGVFEWKQ